MTELKEKLTKALKNKYGIETEKDLMEAIDNLPQLDLGIFNSPVSKKDENIA